MQERQLVGIDYVNAATRLLQRRRIAHPTRGTYEAAELQFWWSRPKRSDTMGQVFWYDDDGEPVAAAVLADFTDGSSLVYNAVTLCVFVLPDADPDHVATVIDRGLETAAEHGFESVDVEVPDNDDVMPGLLVERGFSCEPGVLTECWRPASAKNEISPLADGYRLASRSETGHLPHHMQRDPDEAFEERLHQASLYRPDLDLVVLDERDNTAGYGMFWYDPATEIGVVEPMRTMDDHQQRGLARHILTSGIDRLTRAGATRICIGYEPNNPASGHLYRDVGFVPTTTNDLYSGSTTRNKK